MKRDLTPILLMLVVAAYAAAILLLHAAFNPVFGGTAVGTLTVTVRVVAPEPQPVQKPEGR